MDLRKILSIAKRWLWLLILGTAIAGALGYFTSARETPMYRASTRFVVMRPATLGYDYYGYTDYQQLVSTYTQLLSANALLEQVSQELGFPVYPGQATAEQIGETQFVRLTVVHENPQKAAAIANALIRVLIDQNEQLQSVRYETTERNLEKRADEAFQQIELLQNQIDSISEENVKQQIIKVEAQIEDLQRQVTDLEFNISNIDLLTATPEEKAQSLKYQAELNQVKPILELYQELYTQLFVLGKPIDEDNTSSRQFQRVERTLNLYEQIYFNTIKSQETLNLTRVQNMPNLIQIESAEVPQVPFSPRPSQMGLLFGAVGLLLMAGVIFLIEYLDDTIKTPEDVKELLCMPVIGMIGDMNGNFLAKDGNNQGIYVINQPRSPISEAFRSIRTSLAFYSVDHPLRILLVTSSGPEEGKTTVATNLAAIHANVNKRVLLLDADMRRPNIHSHLGLSNRRGLSDLILGRQDISEVVQQIPGNDNLWVITSGSLPPNPAELLASEKWSRIIAELSSQFDMIIVDSPPAIVTDAQILATEVDGVVYVVRSGKTRTVNAKMPLDEFKQVGAKMIGAVINMIPKSRENYYGGYKYYGKQSNFKDNFDGKHANGAETAGSD